MGVVLLGFFWSFSLGLFGYSGRLSLKQAWGMGAGRFSRLGFGSGWASFGCFAALHGFWLGLGGAEIWFSLFFLVFLCGFALQQMLSLSLAAGVYLRMASCCTCGEASFGTLALPACSSMAWLLSGSLLADLGGFFFSCSFVG